MRVQAHRVDILLVAAVPGNHLCHRGVLHHVFRQQCKAMMQHTDELYRLTPSCLHTKAVQTRQAQPTQEGSVAPFNTLVTPLRCCTCLIAYAASILGSMHQWGLPSVVKDRHVPGAGWIASTASLVHSFWSGHILHLHWPSMADGSVSRLPICRSCRLEMRET